MQNGLFSFFNTSRKVATTALQTFVVDVAREGAIDFRPFHPIVRVMVAVGFGFMGLFLLSVFLGEQVRGWFPNITLVNESSATRTFTIASPFIPLTLLAFTIGWGSILLGALYARPLFRWIIVGAYFIFYGAPAFVQSLTTFTFTGIFGTVILTTILIVSVLIFFTFVLFPHLPIPHPLAWVWLFTLNGVVTVILYSGGVRIEQLTNEAWIANTITSLMFNHFVLGMGFLLISGLGWIDFALQTSKWSTDAVQQHASRFVVATFLLVLLGVRGIGMMRMIAQSGFDGNAVVGACCLLGGLALIGFLRRWLAPTGEVSTSFLMWFAVFIPAGQYLAFLFSQVGFTFVIFQLLSGDTQPLTDQVYDWTVGLSEWLVQVRPFLLAGVGAIVTFIAQRRGNGTLATFGLVLAWTQLLTWLTDYGHPLAAYRFEYVHVDLVVLCGLLGIVLLWIFTNQLTRIRALHLFAIAALMALLNQTDFLDNPFSPFFGFAGVAFLVFGIFWNVIDLAGLFVNRDTPGLSRESRALLYSGYALLAVTVAHWFFASHNTIYQQIQSDLTYAAFIILGYPLAYTVILEGGRSLVPLVPEKSREGGDTDQL